MTKPSTKTEVLPAVNIDQKGNYIGSWKDGRELLQLKIDPILGSKVRQGNGVIFMPEKNIIFQGSWLNDDIDGSGVIYDIPKKIFYHNEWRFGHKLKKGTSEKIPGFEVSRKRLKKAMRKEEEEVEFVKMQKVTEHKENEENEGKEVLPSESENNVRTYG